MNEPTQALALVTATFRGVRYVLLIERGDGAGWAMPGSAIEPGEHPGETARHELIKETNLRPPHRGADCWDMNEPRWVPDSDGALTVVARCDLGEVDALPEVRGGDGARQAAWISTRMLPFELDDLLPAHREILGALR